MMNPRIAAALVLFALTAGCASRATMTDVKAADDETKALRAQMEKNTVQLSAAQTEIQALRKKVANLETARGTAPADSTTIRELKDGISFLSGEVLRLDAALQSAAAEKAPSPAGTGVFKPAGFEIEPAYQEALKEYRAGNYESAIGRFTEIMTVAPASTLADNAQYWVGESWLSLKDYSRALEAFQKVLTYPDTNKEEDAHLKIGVTHAAMGEMDTAKKELKEVVETYPDSEAAKLAAAKLAELEKQ